MLILFTAKGNEHNSIEYVHGSKDAHDLMAAKIRFRSSESVSDGHPDKIADTISDRVLDFCLLQNKSARSAIEVMVSPSIINIAGESNMKDVITDSLLQDISDRTLADLGYQGSQMLKVKNCINYQSSQIKDAMDNGGAGDQATVTGYACNESQCYYPLDAFYANSIMYAISNARLNDTGILSDAKCQVNIIEGEVYVCVSVQHEKGVQIQDTQLEHIVRQAIPIEIKKLNINPSGEFTLGGPFADTGLTGRKIIVDAYGTSVEHGGGCYSGKDYSKLDRSGAYFARWIAKNIVASKLANECRVYIAYMIGMEQPTAFYVKTDTRVCSDVADNLKRNIDMSLAGIISYLDLQQPFYGDNCNFSHFCNKEHMPWERICSKLQKIIKGI